MITNQWHRLHDSTGERNDWMPKTMKRIPPESAICEVLNTTFR